MSTVTTTLSPQLQKPTHGVGKLILKAFLLSLPFIGVIGSYLILDPFQVLYHYNDFTERTRVIPNRDYVSTQVFLNNYQKRPYQSFILGNSRTMAFTVRDWQRYTHDSLSFHYDASAESLYGVWKKLQFLEDHGSKLKNVLIICDQQLLSETRDSDSHLFRKDPRLTGELPFNFQFSFFKAYISNFFFYHFWKLKATGEVTPAVEDMFESRRVVYTPVTNDMVLPDVDQQIATDSAGFYAQNTRLTPRTNKTRVAKAVIEQAEKLQLVAIRNILKRHNTNYHFVISPLYVQERINPADVAYLVRTFGREHIHDFSGVNELTKYPGHYYEESHYRPLVGRKILQMIYGGGDSTTTTPVRGSGN